MCIRPVTNSGTARLRTTGIYAQRARVFNKGVRLQLLIYTYILSVLVLRGTFDNRSVLVVYTSEVFIHSSHVLTF